MAYQFTNKGSSPTVATAGFYQNAGTTPKSKALDNASSAPRVGVSSPQFLPSTPVTKQTITTASGDKHEITHASQGDINENIAGLKALDTKLASNKQTTPGMVNSGTTPPPVTPPTPTPVPAPTPFQESYRGLINTGKTAQEISGEYGKKIAEVGAQGARAQAGQLTTGTSPVAEGTAAITAQTTAAQESALAAGQEAALKGTGQNITALGEAGRLTAPSANFPFVFDPSTGTFKAPGVGGTATTALSPTFNPQTDAQNYAKAVISGQISYDDAIKALGYAGNTAETYLSTAIQGAGGDLVSLKAGTGAKAGTVEGLTSEINKINAQLPATSASTNQLAESLKKYSGDGNTPIINGIKSLISDTVQQQNEIARFQSQLAGVRQMWTDIIGTDPNIPENITYNALKEKQAALEYQAKVKAAANQDEINRQKTGGTSTTSTSGAGVKYNTDGTLQAVKF